MNTWRCSNGERITEAKKQRNIRHAKAEKIRQFKNDHGRCYCENCGTNQGHISCSHIISVKYAQETGRTQLAWFIPNIQLHCSGCHADIERKTNFEREDIYVQING